MEEIGKVQDSFELTKSAFNSEKWKKKNPCQRSFVVKGQIRLEIPTGLIQKKSYSSE